MPPERTKPFKQFRASATKKSYNQTLLQPMPTVKAIEGIEVVENDPPVSSTLSPMSTNTPALTQSSQVSVPRGPRLISWVWNHGFLVGDCIWECKHCDGDNPQQNKCTCTTHIRNHLSDHHNIIDNTQRGKAVPASTNPDELQLAPIFNRLAPFHVDTFHKHLVDWMLTDRIPFRQVESETWRRFIATLRHEAISHPKIREYCTCLGNEPVRHCTCRSSATSSTCSLQDSHQLRHVVVSQWSCISRRHCTLDGSTIHSAHSVNCVTKSIGTTYRCEHCNSPRYRP